MRRILLISFGLAAFLMVAPMAFAGDACGGQATCDMPCCKGNAAAMPCCPHQHPTAPPEKMGSVEEAPAVQQILVTFDRPVWVGRKILMGKYVIEHDTGRQARGEPCTHVYAADDLKTPVVAFHCTHLEGVGIEKNTVVLQTLPDGNRKLLRFQFAGEDAVHGYPTGR